MAFISLPSNGAETCKGPRLSMLIRSRLLSSDKEMISLALWPSFIGQPYSLLRDISSDRYDVCWGRVDMLYL